MCKVLARPSVRLFVCSRRSYPLFFAQSSVVCRLSSDYDRPDGRASRRTDERQYARTVRESFQLSLGAALVTSRCRSDDLPLSFWALATLTAGARTFAHKLTEMSAPGGGRLPFRSRWRPLNVCQTSAGTVGSPSQQPARGGSAALMGAQVALVETDNCLERNYSFAAGARRSAIGAATARASQPNQQRRPRRVCALEASSSTSATTAHRDHNPRKL